MKIVEILRFCEFNGEKLKEQIEEVQNVMVVIEYGDDEGDNQ